MHKLSLYLLPLIMVGSASIYGLPSPAPSPVKEMLEREKLKEQEKKEQEARKEKEAREAVESMKKKLVECLAKLHLLEIGLDGQPNDLKNLQQLIAKIETDIRRAGLR